MIIYRIRKAPRIFRGVSLCLEIAVKFAGDKRLAAFGRSVNDQHGERVAGHNVHDFHKLADERGAYGGVLGTRRVDERQDVVVFGRSVLCLFRVVVERPRLDRHTQLVGRVLYHSARALGQLVNKLLVGGVDVGLDDFHIVSLSPRIKAGRTANLD